MTELDMNMVKKGIREPRIGLFDQGLVHEERCRQHADALAAYGWPAEKTEDIGSLTKTLGSKIAEQAEARIASKGTTKDEVSLRADAKELIGRVRIASGLVLSEVKVPNVTSESFKIGGKLGQSTPNILIYLEKMYPAVVAMDEPLKPYFRGESAASQVKAVKDALAAAQAQQEVAVSSLPQETLGVYEAKGRLLSRIEEVNRIARLAFWDRKDLWGQFNKDVLNRARKSRKPAPAQPENA